MGDLSVVMCEGQLLAQKPYIYYLRKSFFSIYFE